MEGNWFSETALSLVLLQAPPPAPFTLPHIFYFPFLPLIPLLILLLFLSGECDHFLGESVVLGGS